jgi:XTP/dITP diphosphohydrolase
MKLVLASNNAKKLAELQALFDGLGVTLVRQGELGVTEAEEPHITFIENALAKARHASAATGLPAIADDSGLCVDGLAGMPGVISAHYATVTARTGEALAREVVRESQDEANNALLLEKMRDVEDRRACFACTLVAIRSADDPSPARSCASAKARAASATTR